MPLPSWWRLRSQTWTCVRVRDGLPARCLSAFGAIPSSPRTMLLGSSIWNGIQLDQGRGFTHLSSLSPGLFPSNPSMHTSCVAHGQKLHMVTQNYLQPRPCSSPLWTPKCSKPCEVYKNSVSKLDLQFSEWFLANEKQCLSKKCGILILRKAWWRQADVLLAINIWKSHWSFNIIYKKTHLKFCLFSVAIKPVQTPLLNQCRQRTWSS